MNDNSYDPKYYYLDEIYISAIVFDQTENLSIFGYLHDEKNGDLKRWDFFCGFSFLTDILLFAGEEGDTLIKIISEKVSQELEIPTVIDVENLFEKPLLVNTIVLTVYQPHEKDEHGIWQPSNDNTLYIDSIESKEIFLKKSSDPYISKVIGGEIMQDLLDEALNSMKEDPDEQHLADYLVVLNNAFRYYLLLIAKDFTEKESRKRAGLADELLFRIAYFNNKVLNKQ